MHVDVGVVLGEEELARVKPAARALLAGRLERIWLACEPFVDVGVGSGADVRMIELALKTVDRLMRVYEVTLPDRAGSESVPELSATSARRARALAALEERQRHLEGEQDHDR